MIVGATLIVALACLTSAYPEQKVTTTAGKGVESPGLQKYTLRNTIPSGRCRTVIKRSALQCRRGKAVKVEVQVSDYAFPKVEIGHDLTATITRKQGCRSVAPVVLNYWCKNHHDDPDDNRQDDDDYDY